MNLTAMREYAKVKPFRIHQARPVDALPEVTAVREPSYDPTSHSTLCQIGPQARHNLCQANWCKCPCHTDFNGWD